MKISDKDITLFNSYKSDWNKFAREILGVRLDREQRKILSVVQDNKKISVRSGHARGKDYIAAVASLCFLNLNYPSKVINTAPTGRQVVSIMMSEISKIYRNAKFPLGGEVLSSKVRMADDWFLEGFKAGDKAHEAWSGYHSPNIMIVITEATGISQDTNDAIEGLLTGNSKLLLIFNPNTTTGEAYKSTKDPQYKKFKLNCINAPNVRARKELIPGQVNWEWVNDHVEKWCTKIDKADVNATYHDFVWEGQWYRPNNLFIVKVLGEFPLEENNKLIPLAWAEAAQDRWKDNVSTNGNIKIGLDVAGMGRDATVFIERNENKVGMPESHKKTDHMEIAGIAHNKHGTIFGDAIGEGAGVISRLMEMGHDVFAVKGSESAKELKDMTGERTFANMRAYLYWAIRDALDPKLGGSLALPPDDELIQELTEPIFNIRSNGSIIIEDKEEIKKRIGRSPDKADALSFTFYPEQQPAAMASFDPQPEVRRRRW